MKNSLGLLLQNRILLTAIAAWACSQVLKTIIFIIVNKKFDPERLMGDGGMPSSHSATVTAMAVATGITCGFDSAVFAIAAVLAIIVMHDAMGVRLETGKQAKVINDMVEAFEALSGQDITMDTLKELVGHTPLQVLAGMVLGLLIGLTALL